MAPSAPKGELLHLSLAASPQQGLSLTNFILPKLAAFTHVKNSSIESVFDLSVVSDLITLKTE